MATPRVDRIRNSLLERIFWKRSSPVPSVAADFGLTRQAVYLHLKSLIAEGHVAASGAGRWRRYQLVPRASANQSFDLDPALTEDRVWQEFARPRVADLAPAGQEICAYGVTE